MADWYNMIDASCLVFGLHNSLSCHYYYYYDYYDFDYYLYGSKAKLEICWTEPLIE